MLDMFEVGELVEVTGTSKGRGFAGTIKRHGFSSGPETHGCRNHRAPWFNRLQCMACESC